MILLLLLSGCGGGASPDAPAETPAQETADQTAPPADPEEDDRPVYESDGFREAVFHADLAEGNDDGVLLDISAVSEGYVAVSGQSESRLKFQVICGEETYTYDLRGDGEPMIFPLSCGSGDYQFRVMENVSESKYAEVYAATCAVTLADEFQPFLRPSAYVSYGENSESTRMAADFAAQSHSALELVGAVYDYICENVTYDVEKAATVQSGYLPQPDDTLRTGKGICFDYAALAAAMLRSQGIPTKMIFGYVSPDDVYHAWNMFYTEETGWVTAEFEISRSGWNRIDLTFAASGADNGFIGDGSNYADLYTY